MTAPREVYEETGWLIDEADLRLLARLPAFPLRRRPTRRSSIPASGLLQVVFTGRVKGRDGRATDWVDLDGWEQRHQLLAVSDLTSIELSPVQRAFISLLEDGPTTGH